MNGIINRPRPAKLSKTDLILSLASILFLAYCILSGQWIPLPLACLAIFIIVLLTTLKWLAGRKAKGNNTINAI